MWWHMPVTPVHPQKAEDVNKFEAILIYMDDSRLSRDKLDMLAQSCIAQDRGKRITAN